MSSREQFETAYSELMCTPASVLKNLRDGDEYRETEGHRMQVAWLMWQAASKASEQQLAAVVAENAGLEKRTQQLIDIINKADNDYCMCGDAMKNHAHGGCGHPTGMFDYHYGKWLESENETPATDAFLAEVRASGADEVAAACRRLADKDGCSVNMRCSYNLTAERAEAIAAQLRQGAAL